MDLEVGERLMVAAERWLWVREMVATMAVVWVRERERERERAENFRGF